MIDDAAGTIVYDPYDRDFALDPYAVLRRMRAEAPLYYNPEHDFYALSRYDDVAAGFVDKETFICGRGGTLDVLKSGMEIPPGTVLMEDPPAHTVHRKLLSRMFTPRRIAELEDRTRRYCATAARPARRRSGVRLHPRHRQAGPDPGDQHARRHSPARRGARPRPVRG